MDEIITALGLMLLLEGALYALFAQAMKHYMSRFIDMPDEAIRIIGMLFALSGLFIVWIMQR